MLISRLTSQLAKAARFTGHFLPRPVSSVLRSGSASANYSTQPSHNNGGHAQSSYALDPELEEMLVPRKMSITPLESWLTVRYSFPKVEVISVHKKIGYEPTQQYDCPTSEVEADVEEEGGDLSGNKVECKNVLKIRRRGMTRHRYKKLQKRRKVVRRALIENRKKKRQKKFEQDLTRIWKRAGLKKSPAGWQTPILFLRKS